MGGGGGGGRPAAAGVGGADRLDPSGRVDAADRRRGHRRGPARGRRPAGGAHRRARAGTAPGRAGHDGRHRVGPAAARRRPAHRPDHPRDEHLLRVGKFLRRTRLSPKALRLYGARGLLVPARVDGHSGHRWYAPAQVARARLVGLLRQAGMPLARVREVVDLEPADRPAAVDRWWAGVEDDVALRRALVRSLHRRLAGDDDPPEAPVHDVALRTTDEATLLTTQRRLTVGELGAFISDAARALEEHLAASGATRAGALRVVYHGMVTADSDGPVEVTVPFSGTVRPTGEL